MGRNKVCTTALVIVWSIVDIVATTLLYGHGTKMHEHFTQEKMNISQCRFDLWLLGILRGSLLLGLTLAVIRRSEIAVPRIKTLNPAIVIFVVVIVDYNLVKLLLISEDSDSLKDMWYWLQFSWCCIGAVAFHILYSLLSNIKPICEVTVNVVNVNHIDEERKPLLQKQDGKSVSESENEKELEEKISKTTLFRLFSFSKPDIGYIFLGFVFLSIAAVGEIFIPYFTGLVVDGIVIDKSEKEFSRAIIIMGAISFGSAVATGVRGGMFSVAMSRLNIRIRNLLFRSIVNQEIGFFDKVKTGDITSRLTSDTSTMSDTVSLNINVFLRTTIQSIGIVIFMFKLSWRMSMVTVIELPIVVGVTKLYGNYYEKLSKKVQDSLAEANDVAEEACSSMRTVRSFANEEYEIQRYKKALSVTYKLYIKEAMFYSGYIWCNKFFELFLTISILYYGGYLVVNDMLSGGNLVAFILYQMQLGNCIETLGNVYTGLMQAAGASKKVFEYIDRKPLIKNNGTLMPEQLHGHIEFNNVTFSYPTRPDIDVLKNVSFTVEPGEVVALVGPSGSGKTSCISLIEHFYQVESGSITLDNHPIQSFDHKYLHNKVALVGQEPVLYAKSITENIRYGLPIDSSGEEEIHQAAKDANAHQFISEMPDKYDTQTGEKGLSMSGGQKQRLAIARALIRNPTVLLLDEATSALDTESEYLVQQAIYKNLRGRTVIIVAHRLSTVERADRIIIIEKGQVVEQGTHMELLQRKGLYAKLVKRQLRDQKDKETESH